MSLRRSPAGRRTTPAPDTAACPPGPTGPSSPAGAEIHQHDAAIVGAHDVVRLDVAVQQPCGVHGGHRAESSSTDANRFSGREGRRRPRAAARACGRGRTPSTTRRGRRSARRHRIVTTFGWRTRASSRPSSMIVDEARSTPAAGGRQELQRDFPIEPRVPGAVDLAEGAPADALDERRWPQVRSRRRRRPRRLVLTVSDRTSDRTFRCLTTDVALDRPGSTAAQSTGRAVEDRRRPRRRGRPSSASRSISSARRTRARFAALRAASVVGFPSDSASSS